MSAKTFKLALKEEQELHPEWGTYIAMCRVLQESGCNRQEVTKLFNLSMTKDDYDIEEKDELIDYLVKIAKI